MQDKRHAPSPERITLVLLQTLLCEIRSVLSVFHGIRFPVKQTSRNISSVWRLDLACNVKTGRPAWSMAGYIAVELMVGHKSTL